MKPKKPLGEDAMRLRMAELCARTEQCAFDLREKMRRARLPETAIDRILDSLRERKFLDEARFARAYAQDKVRLSGWGVHKIRQGLALKRISPELTSEAIAAIDRREYIESFKRVALTKAKSLDLTATEDIQKLYRHLASKGYETSLITKLISFLRKDQ